MKLNSNTLLLCALVGTALCIGLASAAFGDVDIDLDGDSLFAQDHKELDFYKLSKGTNSRKRNVDDPHYLLTPRPYTESRRDPDKDKAKLCLETLCKYKKSGKRGRTVSATKPLDSCDFVKRTLYYTCVNARDSDDCSPCVDEFLDAVDTTYSKAFGNTEMISYGAEESGSHTRRRLLKKKKKKKDSDDEEDFDPFKDDSGNYKDEAYVDWRSYVAFTLDDERKLDISFSSDVCAEDERTCGFALSVNDKILRNSITYVDIPECDSPEGISLDAAFDFKAGDHVVYLAFDCGDDFKKYKDYEYLDEDDNVVDEEDIRYMPVWIGKKQPISMQVSA